MNKKMNTYLKYGLILFICGILGAVIGAGSVIAEGTLLFWQTMFTQIMEHLRNYTLPILIAFLLIEILTGEITVTKMKNLGKKMKSAEDEESDLLDYTMEKVAATANIVMIIVAILSLILLSFEYSMDFIASENAPETLLWDMLIFIVIFVYNGFWSVRLVKLQQKIDPQKQGDPASIKFTEQWVESCDEAEKELIYQSAYKTYTFLARMIPLLTMAAMLLHLIWNTGITAVILLSLLWLLQTISYLRNCLKKEVKN